MVIHTNHNLIDELIKPIINNLNRYLKKRYNHYLCLERVDISLDVYRTTKYKIISVNCDDEDYKDDVLFLLSIDRCDSNGNVDLTLESITSSLNLLLPIYTHEFGIVELGFNLNGFKSKDDAIDSIIDSVMFSFYRRYYFYEYKKTIEELDLECYNKMFGEEVF